MTGLIERYKPAASVSTHLMSACLLWTTVGLVLACVGASWLWSQRPAAAPWIAAGAVLAGALKSRFVLDRTARRIVDRIRVRGSGRCLGGFLSLKTWSLVVLMMATGRLLRATVARDIVGPLYIAIGMALCISARIPCRAWRQSRCQRQPPVS